MGRRLWEIRVDRRKPGDLYPDEPPAAAFTRRGAAPTTRSRRAATGGLARGNARDVLAALHALPLPAFVAEPARAAPGVHEPLYPKREIVFNARAFFTHRHRSARP
jgi:hypothetical protein